MIAYILKSSDKTAMMATLSPLEMTHTNDNDVEYFKAPSKCGFFEITAITQHQVIDNSDLENPIITTPLLFKNGYWLMLYANAPIAAIEALSELMHCCDAQMGEYMMHCAGACDMSAELIDVIAYDGLPSGVSCDCLCGYMAM